MAARALFVFFLVAMMATMATSVTVSAPNALSVIGGEPLQISCDVWYEDATEILAVRWYRKTDPTVGLYGEIDVLTSCAHMNVCEAHTADNRRRIRYERSSRNIATLTLAIGTSTLEDNTKFICGFFSRRGVGTSIHNTATIDVSVIYPQDKMNPVCVVSRPTELTCSSEITQPVVSLEWTASVNSSRISLSRSTTSVGDEVQNILHLDTLEIPYDGNIFTCYLTTEASPVFKGNCSVGPITVLSTSTTGHNGPTETSTRHQTTIRLSTCDPKASVLTAVTATCVTVIFVLLLLLVAYMAASRRKLHEEQKICKYYRYQLSTVNQSHSRNSDGHDNGQAQSISMQALSSDTRNSTNSSHHSYETRVGWTVAELHPKEPDQRQQSNTPVTGPTVNRLRPQHTEVEYTQYIVESNNGNQTSSNTDYMPLSPNEEVDNAAPCDYEHPNGQ